LSAFQLVSVPGDEAMRRPQGELDPQHRCEVEIELVPSPMVEVLTS
jgi:hypothetical protein